VTEHRPHWLAWVTRASLVIGLAALVVTIWLVGPSALLHYLREIGWFFIVIVAIELLSSVLDATAVYFMAHGPGRPSWRVAVVAQITGRGINSVTPGGNLGEAVKVGLLSRHCSTRRAVAAVLYAGLIAVVISFGLIAVCSAPTAFLFKMPDAVMVILFAGAALAAAIAVAIVWLMRRGMLSILANALARLHLISRKRRKKWHAALADVDARLSGQSNGYRRKAIVCVAISQFLQRALTYFTVLEAGYHLSPGQFLALLSAGVLIGWISTIIPMGLGLSEGGNVALFTVIGAPASLGLALALARRVNQIVFAAIGFIVLAADRIASQFHSRFANDHA
jgi:uncharacterized protein (TIRG00374 family)